MHLGCVDRTRELITYFKVTEKCGQTQILTHKDIRERSCPETTAVETVIVEKRINIMWNVLVILSGLSSHIYNIYLR